jgi:polysaccharide export outer membrane protein
MQNSRLTALQAVAMAEGVNPTAALNHAKLIRKTPEGLQEIPLPLKNILSAKMPDQPLQPGDILFVPTSTAKAVSRRGLEAIIQAATGAAIYRPY